MRRLLAILLVLCSSAALAGTCGNGYSYSQHYKLNHALIPNTDQTDFPVPMCFNGANCQTTSPLPALKTVANGGQIQNTTGSPATPADLQVCDAASAGNALSYEIEPGSYDAATGKLIIFTKFPTASSSSDVDFWVFANNSSVTTSQEDVAGTWSNNFAVVCHYSDGTTLNTSCSIIGGAVTNHGATATSGQIDGAANFNGSSQWIGVASNSAYKPTTAITVEAWGLVTSCPTVAVIGGVGYRNSGSWSEPFWAWGFRQFQCIPLATIAVSGSRKDSGFSGTAVATNTLFYQAMTYDGTNLKTWLNGAAGNSVSQSGTIDYNSGSSDGMSIGTDSVSSQGEYWPGKIDEYRVSTVARSDDWKKATYNVGHDPRSAIYQVNTCSGCGTVTVVHSTTGSCSGAGGALTSCTISPAWTVTAGNTLIYSMCVIKDVGSVPTISSVTDTLSNTFTAELTTGFNKSAGDSQTCALYRSRNITGGTDTSFTATISSGGSTSIWTVIALEVSGLQNTAKDASGGNAGPYRVSSGYVPTTYAGDWIVSYAWLLVDGAFPLNVDSSTVPSCLNAAGTLHTVTATDGTSSATMGMSYCSTTATDANHSEWTRAFASTPDNHNGLVGFAMTPVSTGHHIPSQQY
jgi:hypothetical protein